MLKDRREGGGGREGGREKEGGMEGEVGRGRRVGETLPLFFANRHHVFVSPITTTSTSPRTLNGWQTRVHHLFINKEREGVVRGEGERERGDIKI